jgi:integrase
MGRLHRREDSRRDDVAKGTPKPGEHLFERNGIWYAWANTRVVDPETGELHFQRTKRSTGTASIERAREILQEWERNLADPASARRRGATLGQAFDLFICDRTKLIARGKKSADSMHFYENQVKAWTLFAGRRLTRVVADVSDDSLTKERKKELRELGRRMALEDLGRTFRDGFVDYRTDNQTSDETIAKNLCTMESALRMAKDTGLWSGDLDIVFPRFERGYNPEDVHWTHQDAAKVLALLKHLPHRRAQVAFVLATGAEARAIKRAKRDDLGKVPMPLHGTKTKRRERFCFVALPWQKKLLEYVKKNCDGKDGMAFSNWANSRRDLADACTRAGVQALSLHDVRHVFTGWALDDGISMLEVSKALGHRNTRQLEERYDNRAPETIQRRAEEQAAERRRTRGLRVIKGGRDQGTKRTADHAKVSR